MISQIETRGSALSPILVIAIFLIVSPYLTQIIGFKLWSFVSWVGYLCLIIGIIHSFIMTMGD